MRRTGLVAVTTMLALAAAPGWAAAKTFEVTRHNDPEPGKCKPDDCTLREAMIAANKRDGKDVVLLPDRARYNLARPNATPLVDEDESAEGDLDATDRVTISHPAKGKATIDGNAIDRVLEVQAPTLIKRIKLTGGGNVSEDAPRAGLRTSMFGSGGGIESHSHVTLKRSAVIANNGAGSAGGVNVEPTSFEPGAGPASLRLVRSKVARNRTIEGTGGGIEARSSKVTITRSRIVGNRADNAGGGLTIVSGSVLRMSRTTVAGNVGGTGVGGVYLYEASGSITQSTISGNSVGPNARVGGITLASYTPPNRLVITNSTIADNLAAEGGGGISVSGPQATLSLRNVTVARNDGDVDSDGGDGGGGILQDPGGTITTVNSLIALNRLGATANDCEGGIETGGGNLLSTGDGCNLLGFPARPDLVGVDPKIGQLKRNGGPTQTIALKKGSPAIGEAVNAEAPKRDQRGVKRDKKPDIGAYER